MTTTEPTAIAVRPNTSGGTLATVAATPGFVESIEKMGLWFHESDMFGCKKPQQGKVLALACAITGENPFKIMAENMIVEGRLTRRYEMMLSDLRNAGGDYDWIEDGENGERATIEITWRGKTKRYSYTMEMAKRAQIVKAGSGWDKRPGNMLRSKTVRNGLQMYAPEVLGGALTPEDAEEIAAETVSVAPPKQSASERKKRAAELQAMEGDGASSATTTAAGSSAGSVTSDPTVIDVESTPATTTEAPFDVDSATEAKPPTASAEQLRRIEELIGASNLNMARDKFLSGIKKAYSVDAAGDLSPVQAANLITTFESSLAKKRAGAAAKA